MTATLASVTTSAIPTSTSTLDDLLSLRQYLRVSLDKSGVQRSNEEQDHDNTSAVDRNPRWVLSSLPPFRDVGSAGPKARKRRDDFDALMHELTTDTFTDDGLIIWESSRGSRRAGEWLLLLELLAERRKVIVVTTHGPRLYDPSNDRDWRTLMEEAIDSEYESRKTSKRVGRNMESSARAGKVPGGRRAFGYQRDGMKIDKVEAAIIHEAVRRVFAGESVRSIAGDLNRRGVRTSAGNQWAPGPLRNMLVGPRIAGLRIHNDVIVGPGQWPAIVDADTHRRLEAVLAVKPLIGARGRSPWVLTGFLRCGLCGSSLVGNVDSAKHHTGGTRRYVCRNAPGYNGCSKLSIKALPLEELLGDLATERLADVDARRNADAGPNDSAELVELDQVAAMRVELADDRAAGVISREQAREDAAALDRRQRAVEARLAAKVRTTSPLDFVVAEGFIGRPWKSLEVDEQRVVLNALVEYVTVAPATVRGSRIFEPARITAPGRIAWKV